MSATREMWRMIGVKGYAVSNYGRVLSPSGRVLKQKLRKNTPHVKVKGSKKTWTPVAQVVLTGFRGVDKEKLNPNFKDGDTSNVKLSNLKWGKVCQLKQGGAPKPVEGRDMSGVSEKYCSIQEAARNGYSASSISKCCNGIGTMHKGKHWRFT